MTSHDGPIINQNDQSLWPFYGSSWLHNNHSSTHWLVILVLSWLVIMDDYWVIMTSHLCIFLGHHDQMNESLIDWSSWLVIMAYYWVIMTSHLCNFLDHHDQMKINEIKKNGKSQYLCNETACETRTDVNIKSLYKYRYSGQDPGSCTTRDFWLTNSSCREPWRGV